MLDRKVMVVTGGAGGIGRAIVRGALEGGARVVVADLDEAGAEAVAAEAPEACLAVRTDVTDLESVRGMIAATVERFGRVDVLVNGAGWDRFAYFVETGPEFWERVIAINYRGVLNTTHAVLPLMAGQGGGAIVNLASDAARAGSMGEAVYAGCKAAVIAFSKTIAREHARDNVRVNVVAPGLTETPLLDRMRESERGARVIEAIAKSVPLGRRAGRPEEIAPAVLFLASDAAGYITGQVLSVSGGLTMVD